VFGADAACKEQIQLPNPDGEESEIQDDGHDPVTKDLSLVLEEEIEELVISIIFYYISPLC